MDRGGQYGSRTSDVYPSPHILSSTWPHAISRSSLEMSSTWIRTRSATAYRNPAPLPMLPRAAPHAVRSLMFRRQYCLRSSRAWQRGKQGVVPFAPWAVRLQRLRFRPVCSRAKGSTAAASQPTRVRLASGKGENLSRSFHDQ
jgi:hypothetical protein